ncbi:MAG: hypothetical protein P4M00_17830 [Azospirillaceae bacterium]|nr:hypothetical protein [Azospirillaceae bacterium]
MDLDRYGSDMARWPADRCERGRALCARSVEARSLWAAAQREDRVLRRLDPAGSIDRERLDAVIASTMARLEQWPQRRPRWSWLADLFEQTGSGRAVGAQRFALVMVSAALLGIMAGNYSLTLLNRASSTTASTTTLATLVIASSDLPQANR